MTSLLVLTPGVDSKAWASHKSVYHCYMQHPIASTRLAEGDQENQEPNWSLLLHTSYYSLTYSTFSQHTQATIKACFIGDPDVQAAVSASPAAQIAHI